MKKFFISAIFTFSLVLISTARLYAQAPADTFNFDGFPADEEEPRPAYIGVGGGYLGMLSFMKFDELNLVSKSMGLDDFSGQMFLNGGGGVTVIGVINNVRLGVFGAGGSLEQNGIKSIQGTDYKRTLRFGVGLTAAQFDYAIPLFQGLTLFPGVMLGQGRLNLELTQTTNSGVDFGTVFNSGTYNDSAAVPVTANRSEHITSTRIFLYPAVNLEYVPIQFLMLRVGAGYGMFFGSDWADQAGNTVTNVPDFKANAFTLQFGLFVGLFQTR